jgi:Lrp/AsnC family transcriptional regulator for asnA, asnC and gidA
LGVYLYNIDEHDIGIINSLIDDGRMSCADIARRLGTISGRAVRYRLDRMLDEGVLQISAVPDTEKLGFPVVADVFLEVESPHIQDVAQSLAEYECISYVGCAIGKPDINVQILAPDNATVYHFVTEVIAKLPGVVQTTTTILSAILKDMSHWRVPTSR